MKAILSDVHANSVAFRAVLAHIDSQGITDTTNLGDLVGYGPDPCECIRLARQHVTRSLEGNHDHAVLYRAWSRFNPIAKDAAIWTKRQLREARDGRELRAYLRALKPSGRLDGAMIAHGSPRDPLEEYIFPEVPRDDLRAIFRAMGRRRVCFVGHTHVAGAFIKSGRILGFVEAARVKQLKLDSTMRCIVNVGSVGQPRDGDTRACYVTFDGTTITWHRVPYHVMETAQAIERITELDPSLAERLYRAR